MRDYCSGCGESFTVENIDNCQCGRSLCHACMAKHKQETGHSSTSDLGRFRVQLHEEYNREYLNKLKDKLMSYPEVADCFNRAVAQAVMTTVWITMPNGKVEPIEYELERSDYERLFNKYDHNREQMLNYYTEQVINFVEMEVDQKNREGKTHNDI